MSSGIFINLITIRFEQMLHKLLYGEFEVVAKVKILSHGQNHRNNFTFSYIYFYPSIFWGRITLFWKRIQWLPESLYFNTLELLNSNVSKTAVGSEWFPFMIF